MKTLSSVNTGMYMQVYMYIYRLHTDCDVILLTLGLYKGLCGRENGGYSVWVWWWW